MAADDWLSAMIRNANAGGGVGYPAQQGPQPLPQSGPPGGVPDIPISPQLGGQLNAGPQQPQQASPPLFQIGLPGQKPWLSVGNPGMPDVKFGGFHPENAVNSDLYHDWAVTKAKLASLFGGGPSFPVNSAQLGGDTGGVDIGQGQLLGGAQAAPAAAPGVQPQHPNSIPYVPSWSQGSPADPSIYGTPTGQPSATPKPPGALAANPPTPPPRPKDLGAPAAKSAAAPTGRGSDGRFTTVQYQPTNSARNQPIITALNLADMFKRA
jgi:hypothetical protein